MVADKSLIELSQISHRFGNKIVLSEFSFSFSRNKVTAILGKSGSGKSTLLQIMNGMIRPDQGEVVLFEKPIDFETIRSLRHQMGYVVQQAGLFPHLNIESNISLLGKISRLPKKFIHERTMRLLDLVQLPVSSLKKYPYELSGGEQQRVGLCRAMFLNPPVLLMDEPFASLDYETKRSIYRHILAIQQNEPRTTILVTHDWEEAAMLSDEYIWIEDGRIKSSGDQHHLLELKTQLFSKS